jgi:hypothetical protein
VLVIVIDLFSANRRNRTSYDQIDNEYEHDNDSGTQGRGQSQGEAVQRRTHRELISI